jgi:para-nitrobenzyl esterase
MEPTAAARVPLGRQLRLAAFVLLAAAAAPILGAQQVVETAGGRVRGTVEGDVVVFKGIPFASPPVGERRFREPQPAAPWTRIRDADGFSPACPQRGMYPADAPAEATSEDCLYLNVWTPLAAAGAKLPVMLWLHGGGLRNGSASTPLYAGDQLARRGVLVVTANYRLGALGFLAHPELTKESGRRSSGNYGLMDQIAALTWIQQNIAAFGGDPGRVTVFGQSSGAMAISALISSPLARGLFHGPSGRAAASSSPWSSGAT